MAAPPPPPPPPPPPRGLRVRTVTAFVRLTPGDTAAWEHEVAAAGAFLALAQRQLEQQHYEVQTTRLATQPFPEFLGSGPAAQQPQEGPHASAMLRDAQHLEALAARHGVGLVALGPTSDPAHLALLPQLVACTRATSCTFQLPAGADWALCHAAAAAVMEVARLTGGLGNFRLAVSSNLPCGIPFFPVAFCGPQQQRSFALGTEADTLLHRAFAAAAAGAGSNLGGSSAGSGRDLLAAAEAQLHDALLEQLAPLEAAALQIEAAAAAGAAAAAAATGSQAGAGSSASSRPSSAFRYLGVDTSLAPGLDTPPLTGAFELLLPGAGARFGGPGTLTLASLVTRVLKRLPLRRTGYCGLMLAVCEDQGLAAAAAAGSITISRLLQLSAVCGCGLDTVPVPGPCRRALHLPEQAAAAAPRTAADDTEAAATAEAHDARVTASIAGLLADVNTLAHRLDKPLACRLLPLPGLSPGQATAFTHPYMLNSAVMDLDT